MERFIIVGGKELGGVVRNKGAKNAALPIGIASLLTDEEVILKDVPRVQDVKNLIEILRASGARVQEGKELKILPSGVNNSEVLIDAAKKIRSSILLPTALIHRFRSARIPFPGGDSIGTRKLDALFLGLRALGLNFVIDGETVSVAASKVNGKEITLNYPSVTGTEGVIIASAKAEGKTVVTNVAREPEIVDLAGFLNSMGARIKGAGTGMIKITGVKNLHGTEYTIIPDRIVAGTLLTAAAIVGGNLTVENVTIQHLGSTIENFQEANVQPSYSKESKNSVEIEARAGRVKSANILTAVFPGFPSDMQPSFMALMTVASGTSRIQEAIYDGRFTHVDDMIRMGANIKVVRDVALVRGVRNLKGSNVKARDIRSGAAITIAGLAAEGVTEVSNVCEIDRGYEKFEEVLSKLGAEIKRVKE